MNKINSKAGVGARAGEQKAAPVTPSGCDVVDAISVRRVGRLGGPPELSDDQLRNQTRKERAMKVNRTNSLIQKKGFSPYIKRWLQETAEEKVGLMLGPDAAKDAHYAYFSNSPCNNRSLSDIIKEKSQGGMTALHVLMAGMFAFGVIDSTSRKPKKGAIVASMVPAADGWLLMIWDGRTDDPSISSASITYDDAIGPEDRK